MTNEIVPQNNQTELATTNTASLADTFKAHSSNQILLDGNTNRHHTSRLSLYVDWLNETGGHWTSPNLIAYAAYLQSDERVIEHPIKGTQQQALSASSVNSHLSTIRARYRDIIGNPDFKKLLRHVAQSQNPNTSPSDIRALVLDMRDDINDALNPDIIKVKTAKKQDIVDSEHIRLTPSQAESLIHTPGIHSLTGLRDTALLYFMLSTGLREQEICNLDVNDLRQTMNGELGVHVRDGKGAKSRFVPYGDLADCLVYVDAWLTQAGITEGAVFRGFKDRHTPYFALGEKSPETISTRLTERLNVKSINHILKQYPVSIDGSVVTLCPHDTRRSYARLQYVNGMDMLAIRDNLGHADVKTTQGYIGDMNMDARRGKQVFKTNHDKRLLQKLGTVERLI